MDKKYLVRGVFFGFMLLSLIPNVSAAEDELIVLWTSGDPEVAENVCFMYAHNAKLQGWFTEVTLIVWGPSARLLVEDEALQLKIKKMIRDGIKVEACLTCAEGYGVSRDLRLLGIDVKGMGLPLTNYLKSEVKILSF